MSLENIIKYATNTPANTNPTVMSSVISKSFKETKEEILNEAKAYSDSKGGYTKSGKVYSYGGVIGERATVDLGGLLFVQISRDMPDLSQAASVTLITEGATETTITELTAMGYTTDDGENLSYILMGENPVVMVITDSDRTGLYFVFSDNSYVSKLTFPETIVPIDPKYLPDMGGSIGTATLTHTLIPMDGNIVTFSAEENRIINEVCGYDSNNVSGLPNPFVLTMAVGTDDQYFLTSAVMSGQVTMTKTDDKREQSPPVLVANLGVMLVIIAYNGTGWEANVMTLA